MPTTTVGWYLAVATVSGSADSRAGIAKSVEEREDVARADHGSTLCDEEEDGGRQFYAFMRGEQLFSREISFTLIVSGVFFWA